MILDTSALLAVLLHEEERDEFLVRINGADQCFLSAMSLLEAAIVLEGRFGEMAGLDLDQFLREAGVEIVPFDAPQTEWARLAFRRYGKGRHAAGLNFGDCAAYALSRWSGEPLLYKGTDFGATDVVSART